MKNKVFIVLIGFILAGIEIYLVFSNPTNIADKASNEYSKPAMERYLADKGLDDFSVGSPEWDYYVNVIGSESEEVYQKALWGEMKKGAAIFSLIMLIAACFPVFSYRFGLIVNSPSLLMVAGGFSGILLIPLLTFCLISYSRDKLVRLIKSKNRENNND